MAAFGLQYAEIAVAFLLLITNIRRNRIGSHESNVYLNVAIVAVLSSCLDLWSIILIRQRDTVSSFYLHFICKAYVATLMWTALYGFLYIMASAKYQYYIKILMVSLTLAILMTLAIFIAPIYLNEEPVYSYGPSTLITYGCTAFFILMIVAGVLTNRKKISKRRVGATLMWTVFWVGAATIQFFNPHLLIVCFASVMGLLIIYLELENPDSYIDRETGLFNKYALTTIENQWMVDRVPFSRIDIIMKINEKEASREDITKAIIKTASALGTTPCKRIFHCSNGAFTIIDKNMENIAWVINVVGELEAGNTDRAWPIEFKVIKMLDSRIVETGMEMERLFQYYEASMFRESFVIDRSAVEAMRNEERIVEDIKSAIREDRIEVFYQPIWSVRNNRFESAEALVRMRKPDGGIVPPGVFIPVAEKSGLIVELGQVVFHKACKMLSTHNPEQFGVKYVEVNLSVEQCEDPDLGEWILETMELYETKPSGINLEITESAEIRDRKMLSKNMNFLSDAGISFSLDDFGTGQSNLDYMISMPVDIVKFDMTVIQAYFINERAKKVVENVTRMVHEMGLRVVCEGVEEEWQFEKLSKMGADYIQGYYFSKPVPEQEFLRFIKEKNG